MDTVALASYRRAQDCFEKVLTTVPADGWDTPSSCALWTVRDVAGHVIWGQEQLRHWVTGQAYPCTTGAPGAPHPGEMTGPDPVATWRAARAATAQVLTEEGLGRTVVLPVLGPQPVTAVVTLLVTDHLVHAWDIGHALGVDVQPDPDLIAVSFAWARDNLVRAPGFFGRELRPPPDANEQTRWLAFLGRATWEPAAA